MAAEKDPLYLHALRNRFLRTPNVVVQRIDPETPKDLAGLENCFDTVLCVNVLEYVDDPESVLEALCTTVKPSGNLVILVPQNSRLYGSADRRLGHKRRFSKAEIREMLHSRGLAAEKISDFNKAGTPPWWAYSKRSGARRISKPLLKIFDKTVWAWRRLDSLIPWTGLSLVVVARKEAAAADRLVSMRAKA